MRVLTTSREPLGVEGETVWRVPSLTLTEPGRSIRVRDLLASEAVQLFVERARAAVPDFALNADNGSTIAALCARLDGIPLAIELAAPRLRVLALDLIATRLDDALLLLVGGSRTVPARHQTLRSTVEWSYGLLSTREQQLFDRLAVFSGGWTLEAAEEVCGVDGLAPSDILDALTHLVDKSLVVVLPGSGAARYRLLETLRQFGKQRLLVGAELTRWRDRHAAYFLELAERIEPESWGPNFPHWWTRLTVELANMRTALRWLIDSRQVESANRLGGTLARFWKTVNYCREGRTWLTELLALSDAGATAARPKVLMGAADLAVHLYDFSAAEPLLREALAVCRDVRNDAALSFGLFHLAQLLFWRGIYAEARQLGEEGATISHAAGLRTQEALCLQVLAHIAYLQEDYPQGADTGPARARIGHRRWVRPWHRS